MCKKWNNKRASSQVWPFKLSIFSSQKHSPWNNRPDISLKLGLLIKSYKCLPDLSSIRMDHQIITNYVKYEMYEARIILCN